MQSKIMLRDSFELSPEGKVILTVDVQNYAHQVLIGRELAFLMDRVEERARGSALTHLRNLYETESGLSSTLALHIATVARSLKISDILVDSSEMPVKVVFRQS